MYAGKARGRIGDRKVEPRAAFLARRRARFEDLVVVEPLLRTRGGAVSWHRRSGRRAGAAAVWSAGARRGPAAATRQRRAFECRFSGHARGAGVRGPWAPGAVRPRPARGAP